MKLAIVRVDAALRDSRGAADPARSTTSCCSRARRTRSSAVRELIRARDVRRLGARPAAGRRRRRRTDLDGGQVALDAGLAVCLTAAAGGLVALQAPINSSSARRSGRCRPRSCRSRSGPSRSRRSPSLAKGGLGRRRRRATSTWWYLTGGLLGAAYVTTVLVTSARSAPAASPPRRSPASSRCRRRRPVRAARRRPSSRSRTLKLLGVAMLAGGAYLVVRD